MHQRNPTPPPTDGLTSVSNNEGSQVILFIYLGAHIFPRFMQI